MALIKNKLEEKQLLNRVELHEITDGSVLEFDQMSCTHNSWHNVETGDFKFDLTPTTKQPPNLWFNGTLLRENGVLLMMSDSTNAERPEWTKSEAWVAKSVNRIFDKIEHGRIIFATFASNMNRVRMATDAAIARGRKIAVFGRSMESAVTNDIKHIPDDELLILSTGSQGEPMAALARIAEGTHKQIRLKPKDNVIFSSSPIPGNTASVNAVINKLEEGGANVIYVHASLAHELDIPDDHTFILENGDVLALDGENARVAGHFPGEDTYIDGSGIGDIVLSNHSSALIARPAKHLKTFSELNVDEYMWDWEGSDSALTAGFMSSITGNKLAIARLHEFAEQENIEIYPISGTGSAIFRGGLSPRRIDRYVKEFPGVRNSNCPISLSL
ncbi:hypothetical protein Pfo_031667 [Paulownia fortunei]|nr:hypothetical protein Pfo_031667 [Paulownia fortunei]